MISISHWGMFEHQPTVLMIPEGFKLSEEALAGLRRPGRVIVMRAEDLIG